MTPQAIEQLRDLTFRRRPDLRLESVPAVLRFVNQVGFAFLYRASAELPSVWGAIAGRREPRLPRHIQKHAGVSLAWKAKDVLASKKRIFYGKLLRRSPVLVSLRVLPAFYALSGNRGEDGDYRRWADSGLLSMRARRIVEVLVESPPLTTFELKAKSGCAASSSRAAFDRAMAELQERLLVVKYAELYDPKFTFVWGPLHRWLPQEIAHSRELDPNRAREAVLECYLQSRWTASPRDVERLFGWPRPAVTAAFAALTSRGLIEAFSMPGRSGNTFAWHRWQRALPTARPTRRGRTASEERKP